MSLMASPEEGLKGGIFLRVRLFVDEVSSYFRNRGLFFYLVIFVFLFQLLLTVVQCGALVDDAYISARYARNLAEGFGLVYNRDFSESGSGLERVEGYSNFLWVIVLAIGLKLGFSVRFISQFLGVVFSLASSVILFLWARRESGDKWLALGAVSFLASNIYFAIWQVEGLETALFGLLLISVIYSLSRGMVIPALIFSLLFSLTRLEGVVLFLIICFFQALEVREGLQDRRRMVLNWLWFIVPYLVYFIWRMIYYDSFLPNTYYAKTGLGLKGLEEGMIYIGGFFQHNPGILLLFLISLAGISVSKKVSFSVRVSLVFSFVYALILFFAGGDWMPGFRLLVPFLPVIFGAGMLGVSEWLKRGSGKKGRVMLYLVSAVVLCSNLYEVMRYNFLDSYEKSWHRSQAGYYRGVADWLKKYIWQTQAIAVGDIGYIGYFGNHNRIIDTTGLIDRHLGRVPGISSLTTDLDYIFSREPFCIVMLVNKYPEGVEIGHSEFDRQIAKDVRLKMEYREVEEIYGWDMEEISRTDWKKRMSKVYFKIYIRNSGYHFDKNKKS